jgi:hypothetical protein
MLAECYTGIIGYQKGNTTLRHTKLPQNLDVWNHGITVKKVIFPTLKN